MNYRARFEALMERFPVLFEALPWPLSLSFLLYFIFSRQNWHMKTRPVSGTNSK